MHGAVIDGNGNRAYMHFQHVSPFPAQCGKPSWETTILNVWPSSIRDRSRKLQKMETNRYASLFRIGATCTFYCI